MKTYKIRFDSMTDRYGIVKHIWTNGGIGYVQEEVEMILQKLEKKPTVSNVKVEEIKSTK